MSNKVVKISVVLPAYNEESRIAGCLESLSNQTLKPLEIILVNNNSTDQTIAIAKKYKTVKIIDVKTQGLILARNAGFNNAKGQIIARLDADSIVPNDWLERIATSFSDNPKLAGLTGFGRNYIGYKSDIISDIWCWFYFNHCRGFFGSDVLWGANMAITKQAWESVKTDCLKADFIHEDQDLSLAMTNQGYKLKVDSKLKVLCDFGDNQYLDKFHKYNLMKHNTRSLHKIHRVNNTKNPHRVRLINRAFLHLITDPVLGLYYVLITLHSVHRFAKIQKNKLKLAISING